MVAYEAGAPELRPLPSFILWVRIVSAFALGIGYAIGGDSVSTSPGFYYIKQMPLSVQGWGFLFMTCALLMTFTKVIGFALTAFVWMVWGALIILAMAKGHVVSWGGAVWPLQFAVANMYELTVWGRHKVSQMYQSDAPAALLKLRSVGGRPGG